MALRTTATAIASLTALSTLVVASTVSAQDSTLPPKAPPGATTTTAAAPPASPGSTAAVTTAPVDPSATTVAGAPTSAPATDAAATPLAVIDVAATGPGVDNIGVPVPPEQAVADLGMRDMPVIAGSTSIENEVSYTLGSNPAEPDHSAYYTQISTVATAMTKEDVSAKIKEAINALGQYNYTDQTTSDATGETISFAADNPDYSGTLPEYEVHVTSLTELPGVLAVEIKVNHRPQPGPPPPPIAPVAEAAAAPLALAAEQGWTQTDWRYDAGFNMFNGQPSTMMSVKFVRSPSAVEDMAAVVQAITGAFGETSTPVDTSDPETQYLSFADGSSWSLSFYDFTDPTSISINWGFSQ